MKKFLPLMLLFVSFYGYGQLSSSDSLLVDIKDSVRPSNLLPQKMIFTQRMLWGEHGLYRTWRPLNRENRLDEFKIRRTMFNVHQTTGLLTFAGMVTQAIVGSKLYKNYDTNLHTTHRTIAKIINITYGITATMALTAPPAIVHRKGFSSAKVHRTLAVVHLLGMITTNVLSKQIAKNPDIRPYHRAAAITTMTAFTASIIVFQLK